MSTPNQVRAKSRSILDHTRRRPHKRTVAAAVRAVRSRLRSEHKLRAGGLPAELAADCALAQRAKAAARALVLSRHGRRIDLVSLLRQRRQDGQPVWALIDPVARIRDWNRGYNQDGDVLIPTVDECSTVRIHVASQCRNVVPGPEFPALPSVVRRLASDPRVRRRAEFVGVLYQPAEWREAHPDPALVVKWKGVDGYYCLVAWGGDRARIMEFVD